MKKGKYVGISKVGEKGQIVIPKEAREMFDIKPGDSLIILCDINQGMAQFLLGTDSSQLNDITLLSPAFNSQNDYAPLYRYSYEKVIGGYCIPTRIILNKERDKFQKAQRIVLSELVKSNNGITYSHDMETYLKMMVEA